MITSAGNAKIKFVRSLLSDKNEREEKKAFVLEGVRLAEECLAALCIPEMILYSESISKRGLMVLEQLRKTTDQVYEVSTELLDRVSDTRTSQGILIVLRYIDIKIPRNVDFALVLDRISDPGNLGTILRTAGACGVHAVLITSGSADLYNPKVVRAGMGAHFKLPIRIMDINEIQNFCKKQVIMPLEIVISEVTGGIPCWEFNLNQPICLVVGSEADGVSKEIKEKADTRIHIPMKNNIESYNASVAAGILMFETLRQRKIS